MSEVITCRFTGQIDIRVHLAVLGGSPTGAGIQSFKGVIYDYGCDIGKCDFITFRITYTSPSGEVYEFSAQQVEDYCKKKGLKNVPFFYIGKAKNKYPDLIVNENWHQRFLEKLIEEYLEKDDIYCKNKGLKDEGIVLAKRVGGFEGLKLKSTAFLLQETEEIEKNSNIEDLN